MGHVYGRLDPFSRATPRLMDLRPDIWSRLLTVLKGNVTTNREDGVLKVSPAAFEQLIDGRGLLACPTEESRNYYKGLVDNLAIEGARFHLYTWDELEQIRIIQGGPKGIIQGSPKKCQDK